jgi:protein-disulfide isomerase
MALSLTRRDTLALALAGAALPGAVFAQEKHNLAEMALGAADAPVTVIEYAMFTCPHCAAFHDEVLPRLKEQFIDTGQVRLVFREVYFNRPSLWAAMVARCAPEDRYFGVADLLFETQQEWATAESNEALVQALYGVGKQAGLTEEEMNACLSDREFAETLVADFQKNAAEHKVDSTPSFVIGGETLGNMPYDDFAARLNEELGN